MRIAQKLANEGGNEKKSVMNKAPRGAMSVYKQIAIRAGYRYTFRGVWIQIRSPSLFLHILNSLQR